MNETLVDFHVAALLSARHWFGVMKNKEPIMAAASIDNHVTVLNCSEDLSLRDYQWVLAVKQAVVVMLLTPLKDSIVHCKDWRYDIGVVYLQPRRFIFRGQYSVNQPIIYWAIGY